MSAQPSSPDRRLYSKLATVEQTVSWTIDNFPLFLRTTENAEALTSPKFEILVPGKDGNIAKTHWRMSCYPQGEDSECSNHVSVVIALSNLEVLSTESIMVDGAFYLETAQDPDPWKFSYRPTDSEPGYGFPEFFSHAELKRSPGDFLCGDKLIIHCRLVFHSFTACSGCAAESPLVYLSLRKRLAAVNARDAK